MPVKIEPEVERRLIDSIKRFFMEELDEEIGDLKALLVLEYCVAEIGPSIYNQAIADAQTFIEKSVSDLAGVQFEPEFDYWKQR